MTSPESNVLRDIVERAVRLGAESIDVEYEDGFEEVFGMRGVTSRRIYSSSRPEPTHRWPVQQRGESG
jgi:hypothetical protein